MENLARQSALAQDRRGHSVKLVLHRALYHLGTREIKRFADHHDRMQKVINNYLHAQAINTSVYKRLLQLALDKANEGRYVYFLVENLRNVEKVQRILDHPGIVVTTPTLGYVSVNSTHVVFCPIRPTNIKDYGLSALLNTTELHTIASLDYAQEKFVGSLGRKAQEENVKIEAVL